MTRLASLLLGGMLMLQPTALATSAARKGDQLRFYKFVDDYCNNQPTNGNIDVKEDKCSNDIDSRSFKALVDEKRHKWLDEVNGGRIRCYLDTFEESNCPKPRMRDRLRLPNEIGRCYTSDKAIRSVEYWCEDVEGEVVEPPKNSTLTTTFAVTSWSMNGNSPLSAVTSTVTATFTSQFFQAAPAKVQANSEVRAADEPDQMSLGAWLYHPWSGSPICYHCTRNSPDDYTNFECRSGPDIPMTCGAMPLSENGDPLTSTFSPTATVTVLATGPAMGVVERQEIAPRGSWHKRVSFEHPFIQGLWVCADAEWEKRGKPNNEIRLQGAKVFNEPEKECPDRQSLDLPDPVYVGGLTTTVTRPAPAQATSSMVASVLGKVAKGHDDL